MHMQTEKLKSFKIILWEGRAIDGDLFTKRRRQHYCRKLAKCVKRIETHIIKHRYTSSQLIYV